MTDGVRSATASHSRHRPEPGRAARVVEVLADFVMLLMEAAARLDVQEDACSSITSTTVTVGVRNRIIGIAMPTAISCAIRNAGADAGSIPANVPENMRLTVTAGLAKLVDDVK